MTQRDNSRLALAWTLGLLGLAAAVVLALSFAYTPESLAAGGPLGDLGLRPRPCPGCAACGLSRGFAAASHLRWLEAARFNASVLVLYPLAWATALAGPALSTRILSTRRT